MLAAKKITRIFYSVNMNYNFNLELNLSYNFTFYYISLVHSLQLCAPVTSCLSCESCWLKETAK